jgi:hypothetical protein
MELTWSVLTMTLASAKNFNTIIAIRFLVGAPSSLAARPQLTSKQALPNLRFIRRFST